MNSSNRMTCCHCRRRRRRLHFVVTLRTTCECQLACPTRWPREHRTDVPEIPQHMLLAFSHIPHLTWFYVSSSWVDYVPRHWNRLYLHFFCIYSKRCVRTRNTEREVNHKTPLAVIDNRPQLRLPATFKLARTPVFRAGHRWTRSDWTKRIHDSRTHSSSHATDTFMQSRT